MGDEAMILAQKIGVCARVCQGCARSVPCFVSVFRICIIYYLLWIVSEKKF